MTTTALYLGRFQPFHKGHFRLILGLRGKYDKVVIGLCSCQKHHTKRNPFTFWERYEMITNTLDRLYLGKDWYEIIPIPDIECPERWAQFVDAIFGKRDVVITNNPNTRDLFESIGDKVEGFPVERVYIGINHNQRYGSNKYGYTDVSGTKVRDSLSKDNVWQLMVPYTVLNYLISINAKDRIKQIYND